MSAPKRNKSLRELTTLEGGCNGNVQLFLDRLGVPIEDMVPRERAAYDVISLYRPARALLRSEDSQVQTQGREEMRLFAVSRIALVDKAQEEGDVLGVLHIMQTRASAFGVLGDQPMQVRTLRNIWQQLDAFPTDSADDVIFVRASVFSGLTENDIDFTKTVSMNDHLAFVRNSGDRQDPNFAGRAIVLAKRLVAEGRNGDARALLHTAILSDFSKEDQVADANAYLLELVGK